MNHSNAPIVLGSSSPRRREILARLGLQFEVIRPEVDEAPRDGERPEQMALRWAREKAGDVLRRVAGRRPAPWVIGADTVVVVDGRVLGKPADEGEAREMLRLLSGRAHEVMTGWVLLRAGGGGERQGVEQTRVWFKPLTEGEIEGYVRSGEGADKAGAYGIQGLGCFLVERIEGNYENVVGLPAAPLVTALLELGVVERFPLVSRGSREE